MIRFGKFNIFRVRTKIWAKDHGLRFTYAAESMERKCLANAEERILHHQSTSRNLNSIPFLPHPFLRS